MDINVKLYLPFVVTLNKMKAKYGEDFERLNSLHNDQLSDTDFIDNFIDNDTVADASIDANANVSQKDICSLESEMNKPRQKLLSFNKIFYEITKKYGLKRAEEWLEAEWSGALYLHDGYSASFKSYCYYGNETLYVKYNEEKRYCSFIDLYELVTEPEVFVTELNCFAKYPKNLFVKDVVSGKVVWTKIIRILSHKNEKPLRFIKYSNGLSQIVTDDHPIITTNGDIPAHSVTTEMFVNTINIGEFTNKTNEYEGVLLNKDMGYIVGMILAEGSFVPSNIYISQTINSLQWNKIIEILNKYNIPYSIYEEKNRIYLLASKFERAFRKIIVGHKSETNRLTSEFVNFNIDFLNGVIAGLFDGDGNLEGYKNRHGIIRITSRTLLNQISLFLQYNNIFATDRTPYLTQREGSFNSKLTTYGMAFSIGDNEEYFLNIGSVKINNNYNKKERFGDFKNKKYKYNYGDTKVINNSVFVEDVSIVYDITTETGHFICNNVLSHNCFAYDLEDVVQKGLYFVDGFGGEAPKHLTTFVAHVKEFVSWTSNRTSGACGIPSFLVHAYYFWYNDVKNGYYLISPEYYRDQCFQEFIFGLNQPYLRVNQCSFTNVTIMDRYYLAEIFGDRKYPDGTYIVDHIDEIIEFQKAFMRVVAKTRQEMMFTFPVITYSLLYQNGKFMDEDFARWCSDHNTEWCDANFFVSEDVTSLSSCCRLVNDFSKLTGFINSIGGTSLKIGSVKVNTINLVRIAYETNSKEEYIEKLKERVRLCIDVLDVVRHIIKRNVEKGILPNYSKGLIDMSRQYNTIGINAMYETIRHFGLIKEDEFGNKYYTDEGIEFASKIMDTINEVKDSYNFDYSINVEAVPAERCAVILCQKDNKLYPNNNEDFIYANQWIPLTEKCTLDEKIRLGSVLDKKCGGGQICHINVDGKFANKEQAWNLLSYIASKGVIYFAFNNKISTCKNRHGYYGDICPVCQEPTIDTFQRIVGYLTPSSSYSKERKAEFERRYWYNFNEN